MRGRAPRHAAVHQRALVSGIEAVELTPDNRPLLVGERTNVLGSRKFKRLVAAGEWEAAAEIGRAQVKSGAQIIDVCLQSTEGDEIEAVREVYDRIGHAAHEQDAAGLLVADFADEDDVGVVA